MRDRRSHLASRLLLAGVLAGCGGADAAGRALSGPPPFEPGPVPPEHAEGAALFLANCSGCHGQSGSGFAGGPPLLDTLYLAPRFPDSAIRRAVLAGTPRRHWDFDDMPAVRTVRPHELPVLIGYIRWAQDRWVAARDSSPPPQPAPAPGA
ncbi:MAG TPA: cytochrome c [Gemmatimonadales bacterium]|nr:cytochrome c [Gemmatimonadales bacterium]